MINNKIIFKEAISMSIGFHYDDKSEDYVFSHCAVNFYDPDLPIFEEGNDLVEMMSFSFRDYPMYHHSFNEFFGFDRVPLRFQYRKNLEMFHKSILTLHFQKESLLSTLKHLQAEDQTFILEDLDFAKVKNLILNIKKFYIDAQCVDWIESLQEGVTDIDKCPKEILDIIKPKISKIKDIGMLGERIQSFQQFNDSRVWELKRKAVVPHNMPDVNKQNDYLPTVKEEIENILKNLYKFDQSKIDKIQNVIWLELKNEWQDILDDSLVNWDTPSICAQKCLTRMKEFLPFIKESKAFDKKELLLKEFEKLAKSSVEFFKSDSEHEIDVRMFDEFENLTEADMHKYESLLQKVLKQHQLRLESYDDESIAIEKSELWRESEKLKDTNNKTGIFEK
jgi:hypothetical protein